MAVSVLKTQCKGQTDIHPLLMGQPINHNEHELIITITRGGVASTSTSQGNDHNYLHESYCEEANSANLQAAISESSSLSSSSSSSSASASSPAALNSRHTSFSRRGDSNSRRRRSPLNSGLWISIELLVIMSQIIAAIVVLSLSGHEHPRAPLFLWVIGYTAGCVASLPYLYWRYIHHNRQGSQQDSAHSHQSSSQNNPPESTSYMVVSFPRILEGQERNNSAAVSRFRQNLVSASPRLNVLVDHFKMALDCFFAVWFVVGNVWIFGGHSSTSDAPNLYRLCIVFLTFSCIGYAMPFILCVTLCCCLPCIISILGFREDMRQTRGASTESINALPTYKFNFKRGRNRQESDISLESLCEGGILAAGTDKERIISAEDAVCCICLTEYVDDDELRELPCTHFFHQACVDKWLKINALCPLCKSEIVAAAR